jgi:hypothetical protein
MQKVIEQDSGFAFSELETQINLDPLQLLID